MAAVNRKHNRYSEAAKELDYNRYYRESLSAHDRMCYAIQEYAPPVIGMSGVVSLAAPGLTEIALAVSGVLAGSYAATQRRHEWPLCVPSTHTRATPMHKLLHKLVGKLPIANALVKDPKDMPGDGILYLGSDMDNNGAQLWTSLDLMVRHMLLIGTTGSGKTQVILGMLAQLMAQGSGGIFVDGKADVTTWFYIYTLARHFGLERQLLVINYLTSGGAGTKRSNTTNIFEVAAADSLSEMISSMMGEGGSNDGMWRGRAEALFNIVVRAATENRDLRGMTIVADDLREMMSLGNVLDLPSNMQYSERVRSEAQLFLNDLPGYSAYVKATTPQAKEQCMGRMSEQLGFLQMQFTRVLGLLAGTYGYITGTDISEIDWIDVINQRRTLYVMLPALEKSPESLKQLGRMVVTALRNAVLPVVGGGKLTGSKRILIDGRPIGKSIPYGIFLDEYGSYCVEGFGDVVAQIRSMGIFACFAGQDWASFKKGSEVESGRVNSNTGTKIFLKSFDAETVKLLVETGGKRLMTVASNWNNKPQGANGSVDTKYQSVDGLQAQETDRVRIEQLAKQEPGMAHVYFGGKLWTKVKMYYPDIKQSAQSQVNAFVRMRTPVGVSGFIEEAERKIAYEKALETWKAKLAEPVGPLTPSQKEIGDTFQAWHADIMGRLGKRGAEFLSSAHESMLETGKPFVAASAGKRGESKATSSQPASPGPAPAQAPPPPPPPPPPTASARAPDPAQAQSTAPIDGSVPAGGGLDSLSMLASFKQRNEGKTGEPPAIMPASSGAESDLVSGSDAPEVKPFEGRIVKLNAEDAPSAFSMDSDLDQDAMAGAMRSTVSSALIQQTSELQRRGAEEVWQNSPNESRVAANTFVAGAIPGDQSTYPEQPVPKGMQSEQIANALTALRDKLRQKIQSGGHTEI